MKKTINSRITMKNDTEANWEKAAGFTPLAGEAIVYMPDANCPITRFKIGDGHTKVNDLPFTAHPLGHNTSNLLAKM
jgi:hypothetical protein